MKLNGRKNVLSVRDLRLIYTGSSRPGSGKKDNTNDTAIIRLQFDLNTDNTYSVYRFSKSNIDSFDKFRYLKAVYKMTYRMLNRRSIYLEEIELITADNSY